MTNNISALPANAIAMVDEAIGMDSGTAKDRANHIVDAAMNAGILYDALRRLVETGQDGRQGAKARRQAQAALAMVEDAPIGKRLKRFADSMEAPTRRETA